ncbi:MAG: DUF1223 domain-containing protein, partial [Stellaceae bacterium]
VVELFTSEGCSSCPPADALLAELATRPDVLALSFHIDYWNRLDWKDPFSSPEATKRQGRYARLLGLDGVYTPQIIVDGRWPAVGSDRTAIEAALAKAREGRADVPVTLALDRGQARVELAASGNAVSAAIWLIGFDRHRVDTVERGENAGRTLAHVDVVRGFAEIGRFTGEATEIKAPVPWRSDRIAAILQAPDGRILGAAATDAGPIASAQR